MRCDMTTATGSVERFGSIFGGTSPEVEADIVAHNRAWEEDGPLAMEVNQIVLIAPKCAPDGAFRHKGLHVDIKKSSARYVYWLGTSEQSESLSVAFEETVIRPNENIANKVTYGYRQAACSFSTFKCPLAQTEVGLK